MRVLRSQQFPAQIGLLFWGTLLSSSGQALVWPFLTISIRERLGVSVTTITLLFTLQAAMGFVATTLFSPLMDRLGRKWPMVAGLIAGSLTLVAMSQAASLAAWAVLLPMYAIVNALFRIGSYAMVADLVAPERRASVYALLRMGDNVGIALGPALGGFLASVAYALTYLLAAAMQAILGILAVSVIHETLPAHRASSPDGLRVSSSGMGYGPLLHDRPFMTVWGLYILVQIASSMVWVLLGLYVKENYGILENRFGMIVGVNAVMVVLLQYAVTRTASRYAPLPVIALGALLYAAGMTGFALSRSFAGFLGGMMILTMGELLAVPTATALVAEIAPADMRARYMGAFTLSFRIGAGIGPVLGGLLADLIAPSATWVGGAAISVVAASGFALLARRTPAESQLPGEALTEPTP